jgi:hypothetical protein
MRGPHATELLSTDGMRILIRPDGYVARIGRESGAADYAGMPVTAVRSPLRIATQAV